MAGRKTETAPSARRPPATSPRARERQLQSLAFDLAERQLREGTASSQVITHFLKGGGELEALQKEKIRHETELMQAKQEMMASMNRQEELFGEAIKAMSRYQGRDSEAPQ